MSSCESFEPPSITWEKICENLIEDPPESEHPETGNEVTKRLLFQNIRPPDIEHDLNVAKATLQTGSSMTGDCLFDHLAEIIKVVIKERPVNIVDYFEELSFNLRQQKFRIPENFSWSFFTEEIDIEAAKAVMQLLNVPPLPADDEYNVCLEYPSRRSRRLNKALRELKSLKDLKTLKKQTSRAGLSAIENLLKLPRKLLFKENIQRLSLYWSLCGFSLLDDEVYKLAMAVQKVQSHEKIEYARFWGKLYGLHKHYYIVEAKLIQSEITERFELLREFINEKLAIYQEKKNQDQDIEDDPELIPGSRWQDQPEEKLAKMTERCLPVTYLKEKVEFEIPPEPIGAGLNRYSYFVTNSLFEDWIELPFVEPVHVRLSRTIKKYLTGDLDAEIFSYPTFPGTEKHYLRAMIARITAGTYVAPKGYYRRLTKAEIEEMLGEHFPKPEGDADDVNFEDEEVEQLDNDDPITEDLTYEPNPDRLKSLKNWVHFRPNVLNQGRVTYFDEKKALATLDHRNSLIIETEEEIFEEEDVFSELDYRETGPELFSPCSKDSNEQELLRNWSLLLSSVHNKVIQLAMVRSNMWPGAYAFTYEKYADCIYFGWGTKYTDRNMKIEHLPPVLNEFDEFGLSEATDPTVEMEEAWRRYHMKLLCEEVCEEEVICQEEVCGEDMEGEYLEKDIRSIDSCDKVK